jgi:ubiquitin-conjugating enzyme E2 C
MNEIATCKKELEHEITIVNPSLDVFPVRIGVKLVKTPGPVIRGNRVRNQYTHRFMMTITDEYPYQRPLVQWQSPIFHPNIMTPEEGGWVCTKLLEDWRFSSNLLSLIKGIESLLSHPNPHHLFGSKTCARASEYFRKHPYKPPPQVRPESPRLVKKVEPTYVRERGARPTVPVYQRTIPLSPLAPSSHQHAPAGAEQASPEEQEPYNCPHCGSPADRSWILCSNCSKRLK